MPVASFQSPTQGLSSVEAQIKNITDIIMQMQKELEFILQNLDNQNVSSAFSYSGDLVNPVLTGNVDFSQASNIDGLVLYGLKKVNTTTTLTQSDEGIILCNSGSNIVINLPTASGNTNLRFCIVNIGAGTVTIDPLTSEKIAGDLTFDLFQHETLYIVSDGTNWQEGG